MRTSLLWMAAAAVGCRNPSKLDEVEVKLDSVWALAPAQTQSAVVASPRAVGLAFDALDAVRELAADPELLPLASQAQSIAQSLFGSSDARRETIGLGYGSFALFRGASAVVAILPVTNRDAFVTAMKGTRGAESDTIGGYTCRPLPHGYTCSSPASALTTLGTGDLRPKLTRTRRGDVEVFVSTELGGTAQRGDLVASIRLERGILDVDADWTGALGPFALLANVRAPAPALPGAAGFVALDAVPLRGIGTGTPLAAGVTVDQFLASLRGPVSARIPAGRDDLEIRAPLADAAPATRIVGACGELKSLFDIATATAPDTCRIQLPLVPPLEIDTWVEASELRGAAHRKADAVKEPDVVTPIARELADGSWSVALWGRGTAVANTSSAPLPPEAAVGLRVAALLGELGAGVRVVPTGIHARLYIRTAWANPADVTRRYVSITSADIASGAGVAAARQLAAGSPSAPLAGDLAAGPGGLVIPSTLLGAASLVIPAVVRLVTGETDDRETPFQQREDTSILVRSYTYEAYPKWRAANSGKRCPPSLGALGAMVVPPLATRDAWDRELGIECTPDAISVFSFGPDGQRGTTDDISSVHTL